MTEKIQRPCIVISSARSGSKLLRELLMQSGAFVCYPYDVNYIWMHGYADLRHDELRAEDLKPGTANYIRSHFERLLKNDTTQSKRILEKTVSNSLRLDYVLSIFPDAQIIHLVRDGRETTISIKNCWTEPPYSEKNQSRKLQWEKFCQFPFLSSGPYLLRYVKNNLPKLLGRKTLKSWGPRYNGIDRMLATKTLSEVCAYQWAKSVEHTSACLDRLTENKEYIAVKYEDLVTSPVATVQRLCEFLDLESEVMSSWALENVRTSSPKWELAFDEAERQLVYPILASSLIRYGYVK